MKRTLILTGIFCAALLIILKSGGAQAAFITRIEDQRNAAQMPATDINIFLTMDWYFEGGQDGADMGYSVNTAGDVNGDGYADVIVGSPRFDTINNGGAAFVFYGAAGGLNIMPDWQANSGMDGAQFGCSVSSAGDVNGDGYDDVIVGAEYYKVEFVGVSGEPQSGAAFLYLGSANGLSETYSWKELAEQRNSSYGAAVAAAGDVNHDGYDDVLVGAPFFESSADQASEGKVYLYLGSETGLGQDPAWTYECDHSSSKCGQAVNAAGDVNNDGYDDIIIGAPFYDDPLTDEGAALLFLGSAQGLGEAPRIFSSGQAGAELGTSVATAGDVNGDGFDDLIVGAPKFDQDVDRPNFGAAFIYLGSPTGPDTIFDWVTYGSSEYSWYGKAVGVAGDINQDGFSDILVGAYKFGENGEENQPDEGAAYLYLGGATGTRSTYSWSAFGNKAEAHFGFSLGAAGDVDGDGQEDIIVGAPDYRFDEKTVMGRAFVFVNASNASGTINNFIFIPAVMKPE